MNSIEHVELRQSRQLLSRKVAEEAGQKAYRFFIASNRPPINELTLMSCVARGYGDEYLIDRETQVTLAREGFLSYGADIPVPERVQLPGSVAVSMVVPDIEDGEIVGQYLEEPFIGIERLLDWYEEFHRSGKSPQGKLLSRLGELGRFS